MKLLALIGNTFREGLARKTIITFFAISSFFLLIGIAIAIFLKPESMAPAGTPVPQALLEEGVRRLEAGLSGFISFAALLLSIFATASILPHMMEKGTIDLYLSKPVSRPLLIHGVFLGGGAIVLANVAYFVAGMWVIISLKTGYWNASFLAVIPMVTCNFLLLFTGMLVLGAASRSSTLTIIVLYIFVYLISPILAGHEGYFPYIGSETLKNAILGVYYALPKPADIDGATAKLVLRQEVDWMPLWSSAIFAAAAYAGAILLFRRKQF